jgi:hypothetical protein
MAGAALASPFQGLLWNQYLVQSDAAKMLGVTEFIPVLGGARRRFRIHGGRTFLHRDWLIPILLLVGSQIIQRIDHFGLGYALYRITSDVERLPFPMAPVGALGTMALAESPTKRQKDGNGGSSPSAGSSAWPSAPSTCSCPPSPVLFSRNPSA